jgi:hypothetical protein
MCDGETSDSQEKCCVLRASAEHTEAVKVKLKILHLALRITALALLFISLVIGLAQAQEDRRKPKQKVPQVLIAGGGNFSLSCELYDPTTATFTATGDTNIYRQAHTATRLEDGRVLVAGGFDISQACYAATGIRSAELCDPSTKTFTLTEDMTTNHSEHAAALLRNGRVLIAGGIGPDVPPTPPGTHFVGRPINIAEVFDPKTGTFTVTGSMTQARAAAMTATLKNGRVLVVGGFNDESGMLSSGDLYDPRSGTFSTTGSMIQPRILGVAATLFNGKMLIAGGLSSSAGTSAELYDPRTNTFTVTGSMNSDRSQGATATLLNNGLVLVAGGFDEVTFSSLDTAELYDPKTGQFTIAKDHLTTPRAGHTATLLPNGGVLIAGGDAGGNTAELYDPQEGSLTRTGDLITGRSGATATLLSQK